MVNCKLPLSLRDAFNIPYFSEAFVNDKPVALDHVLAAGDRRLEFVKTFGYKGRKDEPREKSEARGLLAHYPELFKIGEKVKSRGLSAEKSIDLMARMVARWCEDHFGPLPRDVIATVNHVSVILSRLQDKAVGAAHGKQPKKACRPPIRTELAEFAAAHSGLTKKEIKVLWNKKHPNDQVTVEKVREAYRRTFGDKSRPKKKRAE